MKFKIPSVSIEFVFLFLNSVQIYMFFSMFTVIKLFYSLGVSLLIHYEYESLPAHVLVYGNMVV